MGELIGPRPPAIDRLKNLFFPDRKIVIEKASRVLHLNNREAIEVTYLSLSTGRTLDCQMLYYNRPVMGFVIGENGLEELRFPYLEVLDKVGSLGPAGLQQGIQIELGGAVGSINVKDEDSDRFRKYGDELADWVEEAVNKRQGIGPLPLGLASRDW
jgi:hypothetical protein